MAPTPELWYTCPHCQQSPTIDISMTVTCPTCWEHNYCIENGHRRDRTHLERDRYAVALFVCPCLTGQRLRRELKRKLGVLGTLLGEVRRNRPKKWTGRCSRRATSFRHHDAGESLELKLRLTIDDIRSRLLT